MRIALFTSDHLRHKYIAAEIANQCDLRLIVTEAKSEKIQDFSTYSSEDQELLNTHFKSRQETEFFFFNEYKNFPDDITLIRLSHGSLNTSDTVKLLENYSIDAVVLFGTSIVRSIILEKYPNRVLNLHLGLSPYYKGSGTNFFPIANAEFECIGATIHLATSFVDAGAVLHQIRLEEFSKDDTIHTIGNRIIKISGKVYPLIINAYLENLITPVSQESYDNERVYKVKDFTPEVLRKAYEVLRDDGITLYLKNELSRKRNKPIITYLNA